MAKFVAVLCLIHYFCYGVQSATVFDATLMTNKAKMLTIPQRCTAQKYENSCAPAVGARMLDYLRSTDCPHILSANENVLISCMKTENVLGNENKDAGTLADDFAKALNAQLKLVGEERRFSTFFVESSVRYGGTVDYNNGFWELSRRIYNSLEANAPTSLLSFASDDNGRTFYGHFVLIYGITTTNDRATISYWDPADDTHGTISSGQLNQRLAYSGELIYHDPTE